MFNKSFSIPVIVIFIVLNVFVNADDVTKTGTTAAKFLSIGIGARANAMGGSFSSIADDASALYWNPAGISYIDSYQGLFTYTSMFADINLNYFGIVIPGGEFGNFGFSVTALDYGDMEVTTEENPDGIGLTFSANSFAFGLSYGRKITENLVLGATVKYIKESISNSSAEGISFDIGTIFNTPFYGIRFSSSISNYGTKMKMEGEDLLVRHDPDPTSRGTNSAIDANFSTDEFELPLKLQIGLSRDFYVMENQRLTLSVDAAHPNDNSQYVNMGGELALFNETVFLRGGYKTLFLVDSQEGLTLGFGLHYEGLELFALSVDYSYQKLDYLDNVHSFGLMIDF